MSRQPVKDTAVVNALELLQVANRVARGTATTTDAAQIRRAADVLAAGIELPGASLGCLHIAVEQLRQRTVENYLPEGDEGRAEELAAAAVCYALHPGCVTRTHAATNFKPPAPWPWPAPSWKPAAAHDNSAKGRIRELEKAGALIASAIEALLPEVAAGEGGES